jgi:hypothetical protein
MRGAAKSDNILRRMTAMPIRQVVQHFAAMFCRRFFENENSIF